MKRPSAGAALRALVAAGLTALILWKSHPAAVWESARHAQVGPIAIAVLLVLVDRSLMAYRWLVLLRPVVGRSGPSFATVMRVFFVSTFVGTFLPASVGGDAVRAYGLARYDVPASASVASVFMDRMLGVLSILIMAAAGLLLAPDLVANPIVLAALAATTGVCVATAVLVFSTRAARVGKWGVERLPGARVRRIGHSLIDAVQMYASSHAELLNVLAGSVGVQVLRIVQAYYLGRGLGIAAPLSAYFAYIPLILLVMLLPVTINGLGTSQVAFFWFFGRAGVGRPEAFALSVLFVALGVVGNLPGAFLYMTRGLPGRRVGEERT